MNPAKAPWPQASAILAYRWLLRHGLIRIVDARPLLTRAAQWPRFVHDWHAYERMPGAERLRLIDSYPCLDDRVTTTTFERHYFYQAVWAAQHIAQSRPQHHVDIGSDHKMVALLTTMAKVTMIDIRPLRAQVDGLHSITADILRLPVANESITSLSCLHVAEHVGLGRYGDALNPLGTRQASGELTRVLAPGGNLFFSLPVGWPRVEFNANRVHTPTQILEYFQDLDLVEFAAEDDEQHFHPHADPSDYERADYSCGMFWFRRRSA